MHVVEKTLDISPLHPGEIAHVLQRYQLSCQSALDDLITHLDKYECYKLKNIVEKFSIIAEEFCQMVSEEAEAYQDLRDLKDRDTAQKILCLERDHPGVMESADVEFWKEFLKDTAGKKESEIHQKIQQINARLIHKYKTEYMDLLRLKNTTFESIYNELQEEANFFLYFGRKK